MNLRKGGWGGLLSNWLLVKGEGADRLPPLMHLEGEGMLN